MWLRQLQHFPEFLGDLLRRRVGKLLVVGVSGFDECIGCLGGDFQVQSKAHVIFRVAGHCRDLGTFTQAEG